MQKANGPNCIMQGSSRPPAPAGAHLYCCGPLPMLSAFEAATAHLPRERVHLEYFAAKEAPAVAGGFTVVLAKSGREVPVPAGKTILEALLDAGLDVPYSCMEGVCATCETKVLEGIPDHRDLVLTDAEHAEDHLAPVLPDEHHLHPSIAHDEQ